jgi:hypothetical protein
MIRFDYLTVVPDALSRAGRDVASDVVGRLPLVERFGATVVDKLLAVAGREAKEKENYSLIFDQTKSFLLVVRAGGVGCSFATVVLLAAAAAREEAVEAVKWEEIPVVLLGAVFVGGLVED